jgi:hypothetical protein
LTAGGVRGGIGISLTKEARNELTIIRCRQRPGMPDLLLSTKHPLHSARFYPSTERQHGMPPAAGNLLKFAHHFRDGSSNFGSYDVKLSLLNLVGNLATEAIAVIVS